MNLTIFFFGAWGKEKKRGHSDPAIANVVPTKINISKASRRPSAMTRQERHLIAATCMHSLLHVYPPQHENNKMYTATTFQLFHTRCYIVSLFRVILYPSHHSSLQLRILRMTCNLFKDLLFSSIQVPVQFISIISCRIIISGCRISFIIFVYKRSIEIIKFPVFRGLNHCTLAESENAELIQIDPIGMPFARKSPPLYISLPAILGSDLRKASIFITAS